MSSIASDEYCSLTAQGIREGLISKQFSAQEIVRASFDCIQNTDAEIHAFLETTFELANNKALEIDKKIAKGSNVGILAGVPVAFKDNMNLIGTHTTCASRMLESYISPYNATCVQRCLDADAIPIGKLNMDEFAFGSSTETSAFGKTYNPWDLKRVPGGSSGGSAAAVASGMCPITLGSDTGGSIRQPASFCGVIGLKPTYGMVSRYGVVAFGSSLDQVGPFARNIYDTALAMNAISGRDVLDCTSQNVSSDFIEHLDEDINNMKIGVVPSFMQADGLSNEVRVKIEEVISYLEDAGAQIVDIELPNAQAAMSAYYILGPCEAFSNLARFDSVRYGYCETGHNDLGSQYESSRSAGFGDEVRRRILLGSYLLSAGVYEKYYYPAQQIRTLITQDYMQAFQLVDCIVAPVTPCSAFKFGEITDPTEMYLSDMFTISINIAGNAGMSFPVGQGMDTSLPIGAQLIAPAFRDQNIFRVAAVLEQIYGAAPIASPSASATNIGQIHSSKTSCDAGDISDDEELGE